MRRIYIKIGKRAIDLFFSLAGLIVFAPGFFILSLFIAIKLGLPIFFTHNRPGLNSKIFKMIKFRTMTNDKDMNGKLLPNEKRRTAFGNFLRSASLDELPELMNVIKGDMSLVGPRPLEMRYLELYTKEQNRRHNVKPGVTGWAQVNGRNTISWEEKFKFDVWYVDNISIWLDIKIIFLTIKKVLIKEGINVDSDNTVVPFDIYLKNKNKL